MRIHASFSPTGDSNRQKQQTTVVFYFLSFFQATTVGSYDPTIQWSMLPTVITGLYDEARAERIYRFRGFPNRRKFQSRKIKRSPVGMHGSGLCGGL